MHYADKLLTPSSTKVSRFEAKRGRDWKRIDNFLVMRAIRTVTINTEMEMVILKGPCDREISMTRVLTTSSKVATESWGCGRSFFVEACASVPKKGTGQICVAIPPSLRRPSFDDAMWRQVLQPAFV
jgi:hypothetical protein